MSTSRSYVSARRDSSARLTRRRILDAAELELREVGYHAMTISALARRAAVSPQTIYNAVGGKAAVVKALYDVRLSGDDEPVPMGQRPEFRAIHQQPNAPATLRAYMHAGRVFYERIGALLGALLANGPGHDEDLRAFLATIEGERRTGNTMLVAHLVDIFGTPDEQNRQRAVDILWTTTSFELADRLVRRCGWSLDDYEAWVSDVVVTTICGPQI